jgi:predicted CXXCH cytochrome family protein
VSRPRAIVAALLAAPCISAPTSAQDAPTTRVRNCTDAGCHAQTVQHDVLHAPAEIGSCTSCHDYADPADHTFRLKREGADLCTFCHLGSGTQLGVHGHKPFDEGNCTGCHDPHGGHSTDFLKSDTQAGLCALCHVEVRTGAFVHSPAADGECLGCHGAHGSEHAKLLDRSGSAMCFTCHEDTRAFMRSASLAHEPAGRDCLECHAAHASDHRAHLIDEPLGLCTSCHPGPAATAQHATFTHGAVLEGEACLNCHQPHASNHDGILRDDPIGACLDCHRKPIELGDGRVIGGVPEIDEAGSVLHGPVRAELCTGCHELHGSEHKDLLAASYSPNFYEPFSIDHYTLCFECHAHELVLVEETTIDTNFRNGDVNLHFVHVNRETQGRACRSCHATHASGNEQHMADTVPFGQWQMPLTFTSTQTGGRCDAACHRAATYDRVSPTIGIELPEGEQAP